MTYATYERTSRDLTVVSLACPQLMLVISAFQHGSSPEPCIVYSQQCRLSEEVELDAAVARRALSSTTARAVQHGGILGGRAPEEDHHRHDWFAMYVGCCTSGSIRPKGAALRDLGVTRTDQWFTTLARNSAAGIGAPFSIHHGLSIRDELCVNSYLFRSRRLKAERKGC